ncbi:MAG: hypothetical protein ACO1PN_13100 [Betaproteobacteria bacterium]
MTTFAIAKPAKPSGELDSVAEEYKGHYWGDLAREASTGSDRGLVLTATAIVESMLKDLLLSDPGEPQPDMQALIAPRGSLCHRNALVDYLDQYGFMTHREAAAVRSLFNCADRHFDWSSKGTLVDTQWSLFEPLLGFSEHADLAHTAEKSRAGFFWSCWEITNSLLTCIAERESGLA